MACCDWVNTEKTTFCISPELTEIRELKRRVAELEEKVNPKPAPVKEKTLGEKWAEIMFDEHALLDVVQTKTHEGNCHAHVVSPRYDGTHDGTFGGKLIEWLRYPVANAIDAAFKQGRDNQRARDVALCREFQRDCVRASEPDKLYAYRYAAERIADNK